MGQIHQQTEQIFPAKRLSLCLIIIRLLLKAQTFFPPKDLFFFSNRIFRAKTQFFFIYRIFRAKRLSFFSYGKLLTLRLFSLIDFFRPKDVHVPTPFKSASNFAAKYWQLYFKLQKCRRAFKIFIQNVNTVVQKEKQRRQLASSQ